MKRSVPGASGPPLGASGPLLGASGALLGASGPLLGASAPPLGASSPLLLDVGAAAAAHARPTDGMCPIPLN